MANLNPVRIIERGPGNHILQVTHELDDSPLKVIEIVDRDGDLVTMAQTLADASIIAELLDRIDHYHREIARLAKMS